MASPLITNTQPNGLSFRPIQGPGVRVQGPVQAGPLDPRFPMAADTSVFRALQFKEDQYRFDQNMALRLQQEQRELFKQLASQSIGGSQGSFGENYGLDPMLTSHAAKLQQIKQREMEAMTNIQNAFSAATSRTGRPSATGYVDQVSREANKLQQDLLSDQEYATMALQNRQKDDFVKQLAALEKQGYNINYSAANNTIKEYYASNNDLSGGTIFNQNLLDPSQYIYDEEAAQESLENYLTGAVGETELERLVSAAELDPSLEGVNAFVTEGSVVRNELEKAVKLATNAVMADQNLLRAMSARGEGTTRAEVEAQVRADLDTRLSQAGQEITYKNLGDVNTAIRAQEKALVDRAMQEVKQRDAIELARIKEEERRKTKSTESTVNVRGNRASIDREKEPELADWMDYIDQQVEDKWTVSNQAARDMKKDLEDIGVPLSSANVTVKEDGTVEMSRQNADGETVTKTYGKAQKTRSRAGRSAVDYTNLNPSSLGIDSSVIHGFEASRPQGGSSRSEGNGIYSTRTEPFGGTSYGQNQLYGDTWNGFVDYLDNNYNLGLSPEDKSKLDATNDSNKENILNFIENIVKQVGEDSWVSVEDQYLTANRWMPAIEHAEDVFGTQMSSQLRTYLADAANQHGQVNSGVIDKAKEIIDSRDDLSSDNQKDILFALNEARKDYLNGQRSRLGDSTVDSILANRYTPLYEGLSSNLNTNGPDFSYPGVEGQSQLATLNGQQVQPEQQKLTFAEGLVAAPQDISNSDYISSIENVALRNMPAGPKLEALTDKVIEYKKAQQNLKDAEESLEGIKEAQINLSLLEKELIEDPEIRNQLILSSVKEERMKASATEAAQDLISQQEELGYSNPIQHNDGSIDVVEIYNLSDGRIGVKMHKQDGSVETEKFKDTSGFGDFLAENYQASVADYVIRDLESSAESKLGVPKEKVQSDGLQGVSLEEIKQRRAKLKGGTIAPIDSPSQSNNKDWRKDISDLPIGEKKSFDFTAGEYQSEVTITKNEDGTILIESEGEPPLLYDSEEKAASYLSWQLDFLTRSQ